MTKQVRKYKLSKPRSGQYLVHANSHIIPAVTAINSCFVLILFCHAPFQPKAMQKQSFYAFLRCVLATRVDSVSKILRVVMLQELIERFNGKREFFTTRSSLSLSLFYCQLLLPQNQWLHGSFVHNNCFGLFLTAHFLFEEIFNLNLAFAVCSKRHSKSLISEMFLSDTRQLEEEPFPF